ncbi:Protein kinase-like domain protein [Metarhizium album ARSEF 1941]|uniref:non-specific serine/threonine protein kinase n=1 Tax=Metarhizium album (strain ARSEF 1941) TaxID=1081103 RepID=A0A0B2X2I6_METAS|nr:Protein kinase-like domain protein [Metarhizium album ARSEF 1941]KHN99465.1 Protein kinase-like domain protein [Metarhizium album ARSEF 1941]
MPRTKVTVKYGKRSTRTKAERLFAELPQSPVRRPPAVDIDDPVALVTGKLSIVRLEDKPRQPRRSPRKSVRQKNPIDDKTDSSDSPQDPGDSDYRNPKGDSQDTASASNETGDADGREHPPEETAGDTSLRVLTWDDVCPLGDRIEKIAEASYAEVYRVTNERGTSVIKVIRLPSPIKPQTKAQVRSKLVDEEPHSEEDVNGELQISEWLADIPGFVVYKERYIVQGKTSRALLETHQVFQRRMKRKDPGRAQFYPSPSRYLDDTKFLVVELGDAGTALEDWELTDERELWDIFFLEAIALARAEEIAMFEHRDLHEGNLCIRQARPPTPRKPGSRGYFGYSGVDITILDYGLSRAEDLSIDFAKPIAYDLERDLGLFTSNHAAQCKVYRQMRSFLLRADRKCLPPEAHKTPYAKGVDGPLCWEAHVPYTNVLWLAYLYEYLLDNFQGDPKQLARFQKETADMWMYLNPDADESTPCFGAAGDIVCFAVESGWIREEQLLGCGASMIEREDSIIVSKDEGAADVPSRRLSKRLTT